MNTHTLPEQTCKTHKTCSEVKNSQFIDAVFHTRNEESEPYIVSFDGNLRISRNVTAHFTRT